MCCRTPHRLGASEDAGERVVVASGDGIRFVIVASGTADTESEDAAADDVDLIGNDIHFEIFVHRLCGLGTQREKARGNELAVPLLRRGCRNQITGNLFCQETVIGQVIVDGADDIITVAPRVRKAWIAAETIIAIRFSVTRNIQPVPAPLFSEMRAAEEGVYVV